MDWKDLMYEWLIPVMLLAVILSCFVLALLG